MEEAAAAAAALFLAAVPRRRRQRPRSLPQELRGREGRQGGQGSGQQDGDKQGDIPLRRVLGKYLTDSGPSSRKRNDCLDVMRIGKSTTSADRQSDTLRRVQSFFSFAIWRGRRRLPTPMEVTFSCQWLSCPILTVKRRKKNLPRGIVEESGSERHWQTWTRL